MEIYELDDNLEKIRFHLLTIEENLDYMESLLDSLEMDSPLLIEIRQSLHDAYADLEHKFEEKKREIVKGE